MCSVPLGQAYRIRRASSTDTHRALVLRGELSMWIGNGGPLIFQPLGSSHVQDSLRSPATLHSAILIMATKGAQAVPEACDGDCGVLTKRRHLSTQALRPGLSVP